MSNFIAYFVFIVIKIKIKYEETSKFTLNTFKYEINWSMK